MKKIIALVLAILMMSALFVGCGTNAGTDADADATKDSAMTDYEYVKANGKLKIGYTVYDPMNYTDENGEFVGFDTEYAKLVCEELGVEPEFIEINWDTKEVNLNAKDIDCIWNGFTITEEREEQLDFTTPYILNKQVVVIRKADADKYKDTASLKAATLTAEKASAGESAIQADENLKTTAYVESEVQTSALMAVKALTADACVVDYTVALAMVGNGDYADLMVIDGLDLAVEEYGIGFRTDSDLVAKVNEITEGFIADGTLEAIASKYDLRDNLIK
ncbi:MAG: transporter substrate-binding domain-containing protein [Ruminococcus sp.]|nr:transporter substrate-binding domain-containing protein [Ruminococcus sp.]